MDGPEIGVFLPTMSAKDAVPGDVVAAARHAENLGFESVWAVDQLVAGTGAPLVDSMIALSAVAGATARVKLGLGVVIVPIRPVAWIAKQVASMQIVSGGRVLLGVGVGGDRHDRSWAATGVPRQRAGARTDAALAVLPDLIAGKPVRLPDVDGAPVVELAPGGVRSADRGRRNGGSRVGACGPPRRRLVRDAGTTGGRRDVSRSSS